MRYYPDDEAELQKGLKSYACEPWMVEALRRNWNYVNWGPHEDSQWIRDPADPGSPRKAPSWKAFRASFTPGRHPEGVADRSGGEIVGWYFNIAREHWKCEACAGSGENPETKRIDDDWYDFDRTGRRWCDNITQDEVDALVKAGRLWSYTHVSSRAELDSLVETGKVTAESAEEFWENRDRSRDHEYDDENGVDKHLRVRIQWRDTVPVEEINQAQSDGPGFNHDEINRWICVKTRAKRLGVYGHCDKCKGAGYIPVDVEGRLQLVLWIVNPATGQNYGFEIDKIEEAEMFAVCDFLSGMRDRLVERLQDFTGEKTSVESTRWTQEGSCLDGDPRYERSWDSPVTFDSWEEFCWPMDFHGRRISEDHPKFAELSTGRPSWSLDDLNEMIGFHLETDSSDAVTRVHFWIAHPRKGCSRRCTVNNITEADVPSIRAYVEEGRERNRIRLDPHMESAKEAEQ
jgi:hypothetical protein